MKKRNEDIDLIKGVGIFLVVLGHHNTILTNYIFSFHMPLFFFISGIFHSNYNSYKEFINKKIKSLIIPYFAFSITLFLFWLIIGRKFGESLIKNTPIKIAFNGIFVGSDIKGISSMEWGVPVWFLLCLFLVTNLYYFISKLKIKKIILLNIIFGSIGYYLSKNDYFIFRIWHLDTALIAINFYTLGNLLKDKLFKIENVPKWVLIIIFFLSIIGNKLNGRVDMNGAHYSNIILFYLTAILGITLVFGVIKKFKIKNHYLKYIGQNTLIILAYHGRAMTFIKLILVLILKVNFPENNLILNIIFSIIQIILCIPIIYIFNKYLPFLIGKRRERC